MDSTYTYPGYEQFCFDLNTLVANYPPEFIYIRDAQAIRTTTTVTRNVLRELSNLQLISCSDAIRCAHVDGLTAFTARLLYESVINTLVGWEPRWGDGCSNWRGDVDDRWNDSFDSFIHGLQSSHTFITRQTGGAQTTSKGKEKESSGPNVRLVIVIERPEKLKDNLPDLLVPLTRLAELSKLDLCVIFVSQLGWEDIKPPLGASPDPFYLDISSPSKEDIVRTLTSNFASLCEDVPSPSSLENPYHPSLSSLYSHFIATLVDVCYPFTHNPHELQYIAAARWPGFCKPILNEYKRFSDVDMDSGDVEDFPPPSDDIRMRLIKMFNSTLTTALDELFPRLTNASDWASAHEPPADLLSLPRTETTQLVLATSRSPAQAITLASLPRMSKFILLAAFLASTNPAKSDMRMFGRGIDEKKRKRRVTKTTGKTKSGAPSKVVQRLVGPAAFPIDRMVAILGALLEENDVESRLVDRKFKIPGEHTDMEISRVGVFSCVMELASMRLLHRTSPADRLDGPPQFKCAISYDAAQALAKELKVALHDLLWDPL